MFYDQGTQILQALDNLVKNFDKTQVQISDLQAAMHQTLAAMQQTLAAMQQVQAETNDQLSDTQQTQAAYEPIFNEVGCAPRSTQA